MNIMRLIIISILFSIILFCSREETVKLEEGTPAYQLAIDLEQKLPMFNPDSLVILVSTNKFKLTNVEFIKNVYDKFGSRANSLKSMDIIRLKSIIPQIAHDMAVDKMLLVLSNDANINVQQSSIDSILNIQYTRAGGEEKFKQSLQSQGGSIEIITKDIQNHLKIQSYLNQYVYMDLNASEEEIKKYSSEDKTATVRHILLLTKDKPETEKRKIRKKMEDILTQAKKGEDFSRLAKKYSEDPGSKDKGGLYENFPKGRMVKPFEEAAFSVPIGKISGIIETVYGYHILKVIDRQKDTRPLAEIEKSIINDKKKQVYTDFINKSKKEYDFKVIKL